MFRIIRAFFAFILISVIAVAVLASLIAVFVVRQVGVHPMSVIKQIVRSGSYGTVSETVEKRFKADKVESLKVIGDSGNISVQPAENGSDEIRIVAHRSLSGPDHTSRFSSHFADIDTSAHLDGNTLVVESHSSDVLRNAGLSYSVTYEITAPARVTLALQAESGSIQASGFHGGDFQSESGDILLSAIEGDVKADSQSGTVKINGANIPNSLELSTQSGDTEVSGIHATGSSLGVHIKSASGAVNYAGDAGDFSVETASGDVNARLTGGAPLRAADVQAESGEAHLILPRAANASVKAASQSGDVQVDGSGKLENNTGSGHDVTARIGDGGAQVSVRTQSGSIQVGTD